MKNLYKAINDKLFIRIAKILVREFPYASLTTDLDYYPLDDGSICITIIGPTEEEVMRAIQAEIPNYDLEEAANDEFTVYLYFYETVAEAHELKDVLKEILCKT